MNRLIAIIACVLSVCTAWAQQRQTVELQSGEVIQGIVVNQTDEVIVLETEAGTKYQYSVAEVKQISDVADKTAEEQAIPSEPEAETTMEPEETALAEPETSSERDAPAEQQTIELRSGEIKCGTIIFQNDDVVILETEAGARFQYPASEVKQIRSLTDSDLQQEQDFQPASTNLTFGLAVAAQAGACSVPQQGAKSFTDLQLVLGVKNLLPEKIYVGVGSGFSQIYIKDNHARLIPLFAHLNTNFQKKRLSPDCFINAGYMFAVGGDLAGGIFSELGAGFRYRINSYSAFNLSAFFKVQHTTTELEKDVNGERFGYVGNSAIWGGGIRLGFSF